jgi:hypothetical protein
MEERTQGILLTDAVEAVANARAAPDMMAMLVKQLQKLSPFPV